MDKQRNVEIFDSTLRDGAQARKISFTVEDKLNIVRALDRFGVQYIEAGNPTSNPKDKEFFERAASLALEGAELVAFGSTRHHSNAPQDDPLCRKLLEAGTRTVAIFGKSSLFQVREILGVTPEKNLAMIADTVRWFHENGRAVFFDAEHFFDGYQADAGYAMETLRVARGAGAARLVLCDTNGGRFPHEVGAITRAVADVFGDGVVGIHAHDDMGCAVACSIAAVRAGAAQVQGTFIGFGERCGNANLSVLIPSLQLKLGFACVPPERMERITEISRRVAGIANVILPAQTPYVGVGAFAHKGGMHIDAVGKCPASFEHIDPAAVGNERDLLLSEMSGRASLLAKVRHIAPWLDKDSPETGALMDMLKNYEHEGYQFESATASFELAVRRRLGMFTPPYAVELFKIIGEQQDGGSRLSSAMVKVRVGERVEITADEGEGPVNALDKALRKALEAFYPEIGGMRLIDYKVRVMEPARATAAKVRVLIETTDGQATWSTVGVSTDIINASFKALTDSVDYKLCRAPRVQEP